jgi:hypothetical protein
MSSVSGPDATGSARELTITSWPLRQEPGRSAAILAGMLAMSAYALWSTNSGVVGSLVLLALLASAWRLWVPVDFELGPRGVVQRAWGRRRRIPWRRFAGFELRPRGAFLFADDRPGSLAFLNSLFIRYPAQPERLAEVLQLYLVPRSRVASPPAGE